MANLYCELHAKSNCGLVCINQYVYQEILIWSVGYRIHFVLLNTEILCNNFYNGRLSK